MAQRRPARLLSLQGSRRRCGDARPRDCPARQGERSTGWHRHEADFHIVLMLKGWARFMYEDKEALVSAGDCVHQRPGIVHFLFDYSPDMEYLEGVGPANFGSIDMPAPAEVPEPPRWPAEAKAARR